MEKFMKLGKIVAVTATVVAATSSLAQTTWSTYGNHTYGTNSNGNSTTWSTYGNHSYGTSSSGATRTCSTYGSNTYCN
jgi:hypothetical protein